MSNRFNYINDLTKRLSGKIQLCLCFGSPLSLCSLQLLICLISLTCVQAVRREFQWLGISDDVLPGVELNNRINYITRTIFD